MKRLRWYLLLGLLGSCATSRQQSLAELSQERLLHADKLHADKLAPVAYGHFRAASQQALSHKVDSPERADRATEARLWLEAAIGEAEQLALSRARLEIEREIARADQAFLATEQERLAAEQAVELRAAGDIARAEAERSLARAALLPGQRIKLAPDEVARAASALLARAELLRLALPELPEQRAEREKLELVIKQARSMLTKSPEQALGLADRALFSALALFGPLRSGAVTAEQKASLAEALRLSGATVTRSEAGLTARYPRAVGGTPARSLPRLCSIARAYPEGRVQLAHAPGTAPLQPLLAKEGCPAERFELTRATGGDTLSLTFFAY